MMQEKSRFVDAFAEAERLRSELKKSKEEDAARQESVKKLEVSLKETKTKQQTLAQKNQAQQLEIEVNMIAGIWRLEAYIQRVAVLWSTLAN